MPIVQRSSPASLVAQTLRDVLGTSIFEYSFVDFCSGAGGPTPYIEQIVNKEIYESDYIHDGVQTQKDGDAVHAHKLPKSVDFILSDLHPHITAWRAASRASNNSRLRFVPTAVDASKASKEVLKLAEPRSYNINNDKNKSVKLFRLFSLAFHHFDDELATKILQNTLETSDGFAIFELQWRDAGNILDVILMWPVLFLGSWWWFWGQWDHLFWTYIIPVVPFVTVFDGIVSCLRTRREEEVFSLLKRAAQQVNGGIEGWSFEAGEETHTWPIGTMAYFIGVKR